jgi:hypothetical protein
MPFENRIFLWTSWNFGCIRIPQYPWKIVFAELGCHCNEKTMYSVSKLKNLYLFKRKTLIREHRKSISTYDHTDKYEKNCIDFVRNLKDKIIFYISFSIISVASRFISEISFIMLPNRTTPEFCSWVKVLFVCYLTVLSSESCSFVKVLFVFYLTVLSPESCSFVKVLFLYYLTVLSPEICSFVKVLSVCYLTVLPPEGCSFVKVLFICNLTVLLRPSYLHRQALRPLR